MKFLLLFILQFFIFNQIFALNPDKYYQITPDSLGLIYESKTILTPDSASIQLWHIKPSNETDNGNTIIICYGDAGNMSWWLNQAGILSQVGYTVILFDYRGFGQSSDFDMNPAQLYYNEFAIDLESVIRWTKQNVKFKNVGILSYSMGTIMSTLAVQTETVDFMISEGYVLNPESIKMKIKELKGKDIILPNDSKEYEAKIAKIPSPILVFSGTKDVITTTQDSEKIVSQKPNRKLIKFDGGHLEGFQTLTKDYYGETYIEDISEFIKKECNRR